MKRSRSPVARCDRSVRTGRRVNAVAMLCSLAIHAALFWGVELVGDRTLATSPQPRYTPAAEPILIEIAMPSLLPATNPLSRSVLEASSTVRGPEGSADSNQDISIETIPARSSEHEGDTPATYPPTSTEARHPLASNGFQDLRLAAGILVHPSPLKAAGVADTDGSVHAPAAAVERRIAEEDERERRKRQITVFDQRLTIFGDSSAHHNGLRWNIAGGRATLPEDGRDWENMQMRAQREAFLRDSVLLEGVQNRAQRRMDRDER